MYQKIDAYGELADFMDLMPVFNTHCHHRLDQADLDQILVTSYVNWCGVTFDATDESKSKYLAKVRFNSYFIWLEKALQALYHFSEPLSAENWSRISALIRESYQNKNYHLDLLRQTCRYEKILLDAFWEPGSDGHQADIFTPVFRINSFLVGYNRQATDVSGNNPQILYGSDIRDIDEYIAFMRQTILAKKAAGCVALKSASAYDRGLDFAVTSRDQAQKVFKAAGLGPSESEIKAFADYVFGEICQAAADFDLPLQCHTGLGQLDKTSAIHLFALIKKYPETKFVLLHGSYPWLDDLLGLVHNFPNVYPDLCWLPLISTAASRRFLEELLDVGVLDRICWGCDTIGSEESFGALLAIKAVLADVLSRRVQAGYYSLHDAKTICWQILSNNAKGIYPVSGA
jgi:uncharacterized protein